MVFNNKHYKEKGTHLTTSKQGAPTHIRVGAASINTKVLDWAGNEARITKAIHMASAQGIQVLALGELCTSGYGLEDTAWRPDVCAQAYKQLLQIAKLTEDMVAFCGLPVEFDGKVWNGIGVIVNQRVVAIIPKKRLASGTLFYEGRVYGEWPDGKNTTLGAEYGELPIGDIVLDIGGVRIALQTCEEAWGYEQTVARALKLGADLIFNNSASPGAPNKHKARTFIDQNSSAGNCGYVYANLVGSETGGVTFDGDCRISNCGSTIARTKRYSMRDVRVIGATIPIVANRFGRGRLKYHVPACTDEGILRVQHEWGTVERVSYSPSGDLDLDPIPDDPRDIAGIWDSATLAFYDYWRKVGVARGMVTGISGGYDSSIVALIHLGSICRGMHELGHEFLEKLSFVPKIKEIGLDPFTLMAATHRGYSLSTENNSAKTRKGARLIGKVTRMNFQEVSIRAAFKRAKQDLARMYGRQLLWTVKSESLALESAQTRIRGSYLASVAAALDFMMLNTGNMLEMALGYCTQGADMNGGWGVIEGAFKTTIKALLAYVGNGAIKLPVGFGYGQEEFDREIFNAVTWVLGTEPTAGLQPLEFNQTDESALGPFVVQEFIARNFLFGMHSMPDLCRLVWEAFGPKSVHAGRNFSNEDLKKWIKFFIFRWCGSQWKRFCATQGLRIEDISLMTQTDIRWPVVCDPTFWVEAVNVYEFPNA